ncbi:MAG: HAD-IB family hydrolase [Actinomycetota bacterium]|nr:HAD-IB family hydrolase [Actinomycetota bacterium]
MDRSAGHGAVSRQAAFFDVDGTVVATASTLAFGRPLYRHGLLTPGALLKSAYAQLVYRFVGVDEARMERLRATALQVTRGWDPERVRRLIREALAEVLGPLVYPEARELFERHRAAGHELYLVSSSGVEVIEPLAEYLRVPRVLASRAGIGVDGRYDGTLAFYCYGPAKAAALRDEARRRGLDLAASYAYSDSVTDLPMLETVGHPVAVNPDRRLRLAARQRGWPISGFAHPVGRRRGRARVWARATAQRAPAGGER